jgi:hypothetical protein
MGRRVTGSPMTRRNGKDGRGADLIQQQIRCDVVAIFATKAQAKQGSRHEPIHRQLKIAKSLRQFVAGDLQIPEKRHLLLLLRSSALCQNLVGCSPSSKSI